MHDLEMPFCSIVLRCDLRMYVMKEHEKIASM